jgi:nuclear-control-of-ATPase protein 2
MSANRSTLTLARDGAALRVGILATQAPQWRREPGIELSAAADDLLGEAGRVYAVLCDVLGVEEGGTKQFDVMAVTSVPAMADSAHHADAAAVASAGAGSRAGADVPRTATANALLDVLNKYLPRAQGAMQGTLVEYGRPSALTRLWFPLLFLPPALYAAVSAIVRNKDWMGEQVKNAKETVKGFFVQWVWEPIEEIAKTMRGGGEGLGVSPETVKADQDSLERMVVSLGRDYYHMTPDQLEVLKKNVGSGDLSLVLKAYEKEMQSPIKNALAGNLVRTLLIQVQKTKVRLRELKRLGDENSFLTPQTDLSLALERLDQLLRSQQLTFAFVGVAPSVLVLWGVWNWVVTSWRGEHRGKARVRRYFTGLRDVERILITAPEDDARLSNRDRGMIIVSVSGLRTWAVGMGSSTRQNFLDDLRMVENPALARVDKLRVVERMWRCWGLDGKKRVV